MKKIVRGASAAALALVLTGCQLGPRPLPDPPPAPSGEWAVVSLRTGAIVLRDPAAAMARVGQVIRFEPALAVSGEDACRSPRYLASDMVAERYLYAGHGVHAVDLGLYRWQDVRITEVFCAGHKWKGLGGEVFWVDYGRGYAVKDGVLYELRRTSAAAMR